MSGLLVRKQIEHLVADIVGEYTLPNYVTAPAIYVLEGTRELDPDLKIEGTEIIIEEMPSNVLGYLYSRNLVSKTYQLRLVQWSGAELNAIADRLLGYYFGATITVQSVPEEMGPSKQALITIPSSSFNESPYSILAP